MNFFVFLYFKV